MADTELIPVIPDPPDGEEWRAPADFEQELYELARRDDEYAYLRRLAEEGAYRPVAVESLEEAGGFAPLYVATLPDGRRFVPVYTAGLLPRPHPDGVYEFISLGTLVDNWPADVGILAVNPVTPCQVWYSADEEERETWSDLHEKLFRPEELMGRLDTRRTGVPTDMPTLRGLAAGALLCFHNGDAWNTLDWHGAGYSNEVERLDEWWGVANREEWQTTQEQLLECEMTPWFWDFVLGARQWIAQQQGSPRVDPELWRDCVDRTLRERVADTGENSSAELDEFAAHLRGLVGQILRYEARFRADELLPPDGYVRTVAAWDLGRASCMARWGLGARYASDHEMHAAITLAGERAGRAYTDWSEFSAGYTLGRCLHFDEEEFGTWYADMLDAHRTLTTTPDSPWLTVPLR